MTTILHRGTLLLLLAGLLAATARPALAQKRLVARGWTKASGGLNLASFTPTNPAFQAARSNWRGINYRYYFLEIGTLRARAAYPELAGLSYEDVRINHTYLGGYLPLGILSAGHRRLGIRGALVYPFLAGGVAKTRFLGHYGGLGNTQPPNNSVFSYYVAPGLSLQLPYCTIEARLQGTHYGTSADYPNAPVQGWQWQPTLNLQFDLLSDIFQPHLVDVAHVSGYAPRSTWSSSGSVATRTTTYQNTTVDLSTSDVGPFTALVPRYTWSGTQTWRGRTELGGLGWSARAGAGAIDVWADVGQRGVASSFETLATDADPVPKQRKVNETDDQFAGTRLGGRLMARAGIDVYPLLKTLLVLSSFADPGGSAIKDASGNTIVEATKPDIDPNSHIDLGGSTGFFRVILGLGAGGAYAGPMTFLHPEQAANIDRKFGTGNPNHLLLNRYTDPRQGRAAVALQAYASVEAGCATFSIERTSYTFDELGKETTLSVGWLLPMRRLRSARHELNKPVTE
ncbi:MAG: hypothetical protein M3Y54_19390 [Bacteroidota bacterium]|nr:hypothetical protein [Bacteroidota bacterium]